MSFYRDHRPQRFWVAHSGGADSTALVYALAASLEERSHEIRLKWGLHHMNFGLRGSDSDEDEAFVRQLALKFGIQVRVDRVGQPPKSGIQNWARKERRRIWTELGSKGGVVVLGHHLDDVAENVLFRMARGVAPQNITGFKEWSPPLWRPFLMHRKAELIAFLEQVGASYREDASNDKMIYARNRIRLQILPVLEQIFPGAAQRIAHLGFDIEKAIRKDSSELTDLPHRVIDSMKSHFMQHDLQLPQITKAWIQESQKILKSKNKSLLISIPGASAKAGPLAPVLVKDNDKIVAQVAAGSRFKAKRFLAMSSALSPPPLEVLLPPQSALLWEEGSLSASGRLEMESRVLSQAKIRTCQIEVLPAHSCRRIKVGARSVTCKEVFRVAKIETELRCCWRIVKYDGKVLFLSDGTRFFNFDDNGDSSSSKSNNNGRIDCFTSPRILEASNLYRGGYYILRSR